MWVWYHLMHIKAIRKTYSPSSLSCKNTTNPKKKRVCVGGGAGEYVSLVLLIQ